ncbi:MAG: hypothetical protein FWF05_06390 [Oscillospiraceae bacterium]|nr:hypothetical protein [Oscillospiraceae bacterium]
MLKKVVSFLLAMVLPVCFCASCARVESNSAVMTVAGANISAELYARYLSLVFHDPENYGLDSGFSAAEAAGRAKELCVDYVAVNTLFRAESLTLTPQFRYLIEENVSVNWNLYQNYYRAAGISKQTLTKAYTSAAKKDMLFLYYFGKGGYLEVPDFELLEYYEYNYASFKAIIGYLTQRDDEGNTVHLPQEETERIKANFLNMLDDVKTGSTIDDVYQKYAKEMNLSSYSSDLITIRSDNITYPSGFFKSVKSLGLGNIAILESKEYLFLVVTPKEAEEIVPGEYREECLKALRFERFEQQVLAGVKEPYRVTEDSPALYDIYERIINLY